MPVFPLVGSMINPPGLIFPSRSAASIIRIPIRSLTEPPGLALSSFASTVPRVPSTTRLSLTIGVLPIMSVTALKYFIGRQDD
jgi:hypothetical protein